MVREATSPDSYTSKCVRDRQAGEIAEDAVSGGGVDDPRHRLPCRRRHPGRLPRRDGGHGLMTDLATLWQRVVP